MDGLSQSSVIAIDQDHLGQIWLGTRDGLNVYDGHSFKVFRNNPNDSLSISNSDILSIDEDQDGYIWVGTYYGLNRYDPKKNRFKHFFHSGKNSILNDKVSSIKVMHDGKIWLGTSQGVTIYNPKNHEFNSLQGNDNVGSYEVQDILETKNGKIWLATSEGIIQVKKVGDTKFSLQLIDKDVFAQALVEDPYGKIWVGTKHQGLLELNPETLGINAMRGLDKKIHSNIRALAIDGQGVLWIGTYGGLGQYFPNGEINIAVSDPYNENSLSRNTIKSVFVDKKGSVWIGAYYGGVNVWDSSNTNFNNYRQNSGKEGLSYDVVSSIKSDGSTLFFGTEGGGITILNIKKQGTKYLNLSSVKNFPSNNIKSMLLSGNYLWIGTFDAGIAMYDLQSEKIISGKIPKSLNDFLAETGVYAIAQDKNDIIWLGTFGKGLIRFDIHTGEFKQYDEYSKYDKRLSDNNIRTLLIDHQNNLWVGTVKGLHKLDLSSFTPERASFEHFLFDDEDQSNGEDILTLFEDNQGQIWAGTKYRGLFKYKKNAFEHQPINLQDNDLNVIHAIEENSDGNLWLSSNQGIISYSPQKKSSTLYSQKDGLVSNEFNDDASLRLNSTIYFGGPAGVSFFNPTDITENNYSPQVILKDFKIKNKSVHIGQEDGILQRSITYTDQIELSYDKSNFSIDYAIPNFISSSNNRYKYRLKGLENQWNETSNTEANYIIQKPGTYIFEVKGANNDGKWNKISTKLIIKVNPAPWRSVWAFLLYGILIGAAVYGLIWIMKSKTRLQHTLELKQVENENNHKINQAKLEFFTNISHEFKTPLTLIIGPLQQLLADYKGSNLMYKKLLVIESSANHLLQLINRLMNFRKLENNQAKLEAAKGNIVKFLKEIFLSFSEYAEKGNYEYNFKTSDEKILVYYDRPKLESVFYNLISNAFRYTPSGGTISLDVEQTDDVINISVKDSGHGIPEDSLEKIFDRFYEVDKPKLQEKYNQGTGIGLSIAKNIVHLHHGKIKAENQSQGGAVFKVELKAGRKHLSDIDIIKNFKFSDDISQYTSQLKSEDVLNQDFEDLIVEEGKETVLLVEDNKPLLSFMHNLLKNKYNVIKAENGKRALEKTIKYMPDLIVSDVIMPEMVGTELCSKIKKNVKTSHIPIILLTSRSALVYKFEGLESGADDYISKPFNIQEFLLRIKNLLDSTQRLKNKFSSEYSLTPSDITVSSLDEELLKKALDIVTDNISNELFDIHTFSDELGVSRTMLFNKIKAWTNCTPNEFIQQVRMKHAATLLETGKINISEVSYQVGFKNPKYFAKCFKKKYGRTPTQYSNTFFEVSGKNS